MTQPTARPLRPTQPLTAKPAGYLQLESYSSLKQLWSYLEAADRAGRRLTLQRGDTEQTCRRRIQGYHLPNAGGLVDASRVEAALADGLALHPALISLLSGDVGPLQVTLNEGYDLHCDFVLALTSGRDLIVRPELRYRPSEFTPPNLPLPADVPLHPRRFGRDELRLLLDRACGLG
ncbi:hypothetical protein [Deinococcus sonorensis]|uniref:Uncharacterized protein n=2 Tax=Deinococcus sonorensis TaxID=309891 RepID=A0AAU7UAF6_9DEIO